MRACCLLRQFALTFALTDFLQGRAPSKMHQLRADATCAFRLFLKLTQVQTWSVCRPN